MRFNPGMLKDKIAIMELKEVDNELNQTVQQYVQMKKVSAKVKDIRGNKFYEAKKLVPEITHFIYVRYSRKTITTDMLIKHKDKTYEVNFVNDMYDDKTLIEIQCIEYVKKVKKDV